MAFTARFVDGISATAGVRLPVNDGTTWTVLHDEVDLSPPALKRAWAGSLATDGETLSASAFENRVLRLPLRLYATSEALRVAQLQTLARELNRETNIFELDTGVAPVFFRTYRSPDFGLVRDGPDTWKITLNVVAAPAAVGLREDLAPVTVSNDPAAALNGCYFDLTGIKGDIAAPIVLKDTTGLRSFGLLAVRQHGTPSDYTFFTQAELQSLGSDTANPGGGPDAAMSGIGTNNYARTSFATTTTMAQRIAWTISFNATQRLQMRGEFRVYAIVRRSDATSVMKVRCRTATMTGETFTIPATTDRQILDLGVVAYGTMAPARPGLAAVDAAVGNGTLAFDASRESGTGTLDWDLLFAIPADEASLSWWTGGASYTAQDALIDSVNAQVYRITNGGDPFAGTAEVYDEVNIDVDGGFPQVVPNQTNRFYLLTSAGSSPYVGADKSHSQVISGHYWPQYLYVRPAGS